MTGATLLIVEAAVVIAAAPLCGVALAVRQFRGVGRVAVIGAVMGVTSIAGMLGSRALTREAVGVALASQVTLVAAALALGGIGAWCGSIFRDPLDAAACSAAVVLVATCGLFATGSLSADLPTPVVNAVLLANPIIAITSAANIDLLRSDFLYQISPIAHRRFDYPAWYLAVTCFSVVALIAAAGVARARRLKEVR